jgi:hypothetical protein
MPIPLDELKVDVARLDFTPTGIFVRAKDPSGKWISTDIVHLDKQSLLAWLRSRGGKNQWAENTIAQLFRHGPFDEES